MAEVGAQLVYSRQEVALRCAELVPVLPCGHGGSDLVSQGRWDPQAHAGVWLQPGSRRPVLGSAMLTRGPGSWCCRLPAGEPSGPLCPRMSGGRVGLEQPHASVCLSLGPLNSSTGRGAVDSARKPHCLTRANGAARGSVTEHICNSWGDTVVSAGLPWTVVRVVHCSSAGAVGLSSSELPWPWRTALCRSL